MASRMLIRLWSNDCRKFVKLSWALLSVFSLSFIRSGIFSSTESIIFSRICSTFGSSLRDLAMPRVLKRSVIEGRDAQLAMYLKKKSQKWILSKVSLLGVDSLWGWLHVYSCRLGVIVVYLCYFALFEDFSQ